MEIELYSNMLRSEKALLFRPKSNRTTVFNILTNNILYAE